MSTTSSKSTPQQRNAGSTTFGKGRAPAKRSHAEAQAKVAANAAVVAAMNAQKEKELTELSARIAAAAVAPIENRVERIAAAKQECSELKSWEKAGRKGKRPLTTNYDALQLAYAEKVENGGSGTTTKRSSSKATTKRSSTSSSSSAALQFMVGGKPVIAAHNRLSGISRATGMKGGKRISTDDLRKLMTKAGITEPDATEWSFELPNGVVIAAVAAGSAAAAPEPAAKKAAPPAAKAVAKAVAKKAPAKKAAASTPTPKQQGVSAAASKSLQQKRAAKAS